jgi:hypothetical protein
MIRTAIRDARSGGVHTHQATPEMSSDLTPDQATHYVTTDRTPSPDDQATPRVSPDSPIRRHFRSDQATHRDVPPPPRHTSPKRSTSPTTAEEQLRTAVTPTRETPHTEPAPVVEIFPGASQEPPYRWQPPGRRLTRAEEARAEATARREAARRANREATP